LVSIVLSPTFSKAHAPIRSKKYNDQALFEDNSFFFARLKNDEMDLTFFIPKYNSLHFYPAAFYLARAIIVF